jgi:AcrR family transcriptional regulator
MTADEPRRSRRALQAEQTRDDILQAARRRFADVGYAATSLKDIAADAHVSVQTVYDSVGSKPDLVRRLNDLMDREAEVGEIARTIGTETDPAALARVPARVTRRLVERCGDILRACLAGSQAEPDLLPLIEEGGRRHRAGAQATAGRLAALGALRDDLPTDDAARTIAALADFRLALVLVEDHGLDLDQLEAWIGDTTARAVLAPRPKRNRAAKA